MDYEKILKGSEWVMLCESPLEIQHDDGSRATGLAAKIVLDALEEEHSAKIFILVEIDAKGSLCGECTGRNVNNYCFTFGQWIDEETNERCPECIDAETEE